MNRWLFFVAIVSTLLLPSTWAADSSSFAVTGSVSPDGQRDIIFFDHSSDICAAGSAKIREVKTGKILGVFDWDGFGYYEQPNEPFRVLWRPDSRGFAIKWEPYANFVTCAVHVQSRGGWQQVKLPDLGKLSAQLARAAGPKHTEFYEPHNGHGYESPLAWLPGNRLRVETMYSGIATLDKEGSWDQRFWFALGITQPTIHTKPRAVVKEAGLAPLSVYHN